MTPPTPPKGRIVHDDICRKCGRSWFDPFTDHAPCIARAFVANPPPPKPHGSPDDVQWETDE